MECRNVRNVKTLPDTKCHTFLEPQARADLNDDGNVRNGRNVGNVRNFGNIRNAEISVMSGSSVIPFGTTRILRFCMVVDWECL